jgi:hypothetical protein
MKVFELPIETKAATGFSHKCIVTHDDLTDTDASQTLNLLPVVAGTAVFRAATKVVTTFDSTTDTSLIATTFKIGHNDTTADDDAFITSQETNPSGTVVTYKVHPSTTPFVFVAGTTASPKYIQALVDCTAAKLLSALDSGEIHIYLGVAPVSAL